MALDKSQGRPDGLDAMQFFRQTNLDFLSVGLYPIFLRGYLTYSTGV
jgi:hypothetical protein